MNPIVRKSMSTLVIQPSFRAPYICLLFSGFSNVCHSTAFWPTALKLGCITHFDMLSLVMWFISWVNEIQFMLISSRHIWIGLQTCERRIIDCNFLLQCLVNEIISADQMDDVGFYRSDRCLKRFPFFLICRVMRYGRLWVDALSTSDPVLVERGS